MNNYVCKSKPVLIKKQQQFTYKKCKLFYIVNKPITMFKATAIYLAKGC